MTHAAKRPRRQRKGDRLTYSGADPAEVRCDYALGPFDRLVLEMDRKWGIDRLEEIVSPETAERYGRAMAQLNDAISANDPERTAHKAAVAMKGLHVMDAEAEANGAPKAAGNYIEYHIGAFRIALVQDIREWPKVKELRPDLAIYSIREAAIALKAYAETGLIDAVKAEMPGAEIKEIRNIEYAVGHDPNPQDEIEF